MHINRTFFLLILIVLLAVTACAPPGEVTPTVPMQPVSPTALEPNLEPSPTSVPPLSLAVVGDSIPYNSPNDCPSCTAFVDLYAEAITEATGRPVDIQNLSEHNSLQIDGLLAELKHDNLRRDALANADIIIVAIAHNDAAMNTNSDLCDGINGDIPDWSKYNAECAIASAELFRSKFESVYSQLVELRGGKPTLFRTINRYNDWIGWPGHDVPPEGVAATRLVIDAWNEMICQAAQENGFLCADIYTLFNGEDGLKPSGDLLASDYTHPSQKGNDAIAQVLIDLGLEPLVSSHPFTGDTSWIAYQTNRGGSEGIWLIHPDGSEDHKLDTGWSGPTLLPAWSPDGTKMIFETRGGTTEPLFEYDLTTETSRQLFACEDPCIGDGEPAYSPDGTQVVFGRALLPFAYSEILGEEVPSGCGLWIGDAATGEVRQLTGWDQACDLREASPRWSPDGSKIAYFRERYDDAGVTNAIFVIEVAGGEEQQLTDWGLVAGYPDWSPDGQWIVFATHPLWTFNFDSVVSNLYRMRPDGSEIEQLTFYESPQIRANQPRYTPDGKWILFTAVTSSSRSLWAIPSEGGEPVVIAQGGIYTHGTWQP